MDEALLGVGWLHLHGGPEVMSPRGVHYWGSDTASAACEFVRAHGAIVLPWVPVLEGAIIGYEAVWTNCPWIQCYSRDYNRKLQLAHMEAMRLGFPSGAPFHSLGIPVVPVILWTSHFSEEVLNQLNVAMSAHQVLRATP